MNLGVCILFPALGWAVALGPATPAAMEPPVAQGPDGRALYEKYCQPCHGPPGGAPSPALLKAMENLKSITNPAFLAHTPDDYLIRVITTGRDRMPAFAGRMTPGETLAVVKFIRSFEAGADGEGARTP